MAKVRVTINAQEGEFEDRELYNISTVFGGNRQIAYTRNDIFINPATDTETDKGKKPDNGAYTESTEMYDRSILGRVARALIEARLTEVDPSVKLFSVTAEDPDNAGQTISVDLPWRELDEAQQVEALAQLDAEIIAQFEIEKNA